MLASLLFVLAADPAVAAVPTTAPVVAAAAVDSSKKVICRNEETTGSRLGNVRVCMTKAQWEQRSADDEQTLGDTQNRAALHAFPNH